MEFLTASLRSRQFFEEALFSVVERGATAAVRSAMKFKYISFDWIGSPGWFFWPRARQGVYLVKEQVVQQDGADITARFSLYYYPHPHEDVFLDFSLAEQVARVSHIFGNQGVQFFEACPEHGHCGCSEEPFQDLKAGKGIPAAADRERLAVSLYWVGTLTFVWRGDKLKELTLEAPRRSRTWAIVDIPGPRDDGPALKAGDIDRNVPCWHLARSFAVALTEDFGLAISYVRQFDDLGKDAMKRCVIGLRSQEN